MLLADESAGVVGAVHAGWKGALDGVIEAGVAAMEKLGAQRPRIVAAIGPLIRKESYEVGPSSSPVSAPTIPATAAISR